MSKVFICPARPAAQKKDQMVGLERKRTPLKEKKMSCYDKSQGQAYTLSKKADAQRA